jgi:hypothetical protein
MDLSKLDAKIAIEGKLANVQSSLKVFSQLTAKAEKLEAELAALKSQEEAILNDERRTDADRLPDLLTVRGQIDLKQTAVDQLRGKPAVGNNAKPTTGKIGLAEEVVSKAGEVVGQFLVAYHHAIKVALDDKIADACNGFITKEDRPLLLALAANHPDVKQVHYFDHPIFIKSPVRGYADDIVHARALDIKWSQMAELADKIGGELSVSIPDPWLE